MFFDAFHASTQTTQTAASAGRLNLRYEAIFTQNADVFKDARVLDIASQTVVVARRPPFGCRRGRRDRGREDLVRQLGESRRLRAGHPYDFGVGDVFEVLAEEQFQVDVVLCLGFLYRTLHNELLRRIRDLDPRYLIVDTAVLANQKKPTVKLRAEQSDRARNAVSDQFSHENSTVVGTPSLPALRLILESYGFEIERFSDWEGLVRDNSALGHVKDYAHGRRVTARCIASEYASAT